MQGTVTGSLVTGVCLHPEMDLHMYTRMWPSPRSGAGRVASTPAEQHPPHCKQCRLPCASNHLQLPVPGRNGPVSHFWPFPGALMLAWWAFHLSCAPTRPQGGYPVRCQRYRPRNAEPHQDLEILYLHVGIIESKFESFYHIHVPLVPLPK